MTSITLPWPHKDLSPNGKAGRQKKARRIARYRRDGFYATIAAGRPRLSEPLSYTLTFHPPSQKHRMDDDNAIASMKAGLDGIADAIGVDDRKWSFSGISWGETRRGGEVVVTLS